MDGYPQRSASLKARENEKSGDSGGGRIVPKLSFPLKINPRGLQIAGGLDVRPIASRVNSADAFSPILTAGSGQC